MLRAPIIAIDGPAGSGKSTAAKNLAKSLGFDYLDTGAMYRAATWSALHNGVSLDDEAALVSHIERIHIRLVAEGDTSRVFVDDVEVTRQIRSERISRNVHYVARSADCRRLIVRLQREIAADGGVVAEGRDIGTVVFPDAELKFFLVADVRERARRRLAELLAAGEQADIEEVLHQIKMRDRRDTHRKASPLSRAPDAIEVDTTSYSIQQTLDELLRIVWARFPQLEVPGKRQHAQPEA